MPLNPRTGLSVEPLAISEAAQRIQRTPRTVHNYIKRGLLTKYRLGGRVYVDRNEVDTLLTAVTPDTGDAA
ncbi:helix-turn-helix domain-containing protein [Williamsia sp. DF01-3]|uniref:helix-turn-helix domain-containing protein n=1 Tax=Williamsia sp. DF01-3 TaxID=2934157 RepID=UPI001FF20118|nr:helix-turn-helix domain-containing protein [Williamsia sp. DF01-3]MCK0516979.1 helix-turn-helix domain-containing protein [Williamsia sp. DF01-3]